MSKIPPILSIILVVLMLILATISQKQESATMDEVAHIPAGYSYLTQRDMRLNPEHPPLLKDLSAIPLLFIKNINFPSQIKSWKEEVNSQWDFGFAFLYNSNNDADKIIFWSRLPMLLLLIALGFFVYRWTKELYGKWPALLAIFLFSFSPTFIAHGRYVTTDVGAALGFFVATYYFVKCLSAEASGEGGAKIKYWIIAGIFFGLAQLIKFSLVLLIPYFGILLLIWIYIRHREVKPPFGGLTSENFLKIFFAYILKFILIVVIGYILVYPIYLFHVSNYPAEKQISDTQYHSSHFPFKPAAKLVDWMVEKPILRPWAQYLLGLFMVFQRAAGGNTTYFLGEVNNVGWLSYFPIVYAIKPPLALHILTIIAILFLAWQINLKQVIRLPFGNRITKNLKQYFPEIAMLIFLAIYWAVSIKSNLNIGIRHILPTFPFVYVLISGQIKRIFEYVKSKRFNLRFSEVKPPKISFEIWCLVLGALLLWYALSSLNIFPYYLTHFNELIGGVKNGYIYVTDSNLDWGQDLKRLTKWVNEQGIKKIKVDYFGGATVEYYLGNKYEHWWAERNPQEAKDSWLAISATFLQQNRAIPTKGFDKKTDYYLWLYEYEPITVIGNSIFVYYIPK
ncbi:MAG: ArnT family glycosyltransferase [Patescibacteria group bacterium]